MSNYPKALAVGLCAHLKTVSKLRDGHTFSAHKAGLKISPDGSKTAQGDNLAFLDLPNLILESVKVEEPVYLW